MGVSQRQRTPSGEKMAGCGIEMGQKKTTAFWLVMLTAIFSLKAQSPEDPRVIWKPLRRFVGQWEGRGDGEPGGVHSLKEMKTSPNYEVQVSLEMTSPFVPDGRHSLAALSLKVVFPAVTFEFDPDGDPLLGRCQANTEKGKGVLSQLVLNDVQRGDVRFPTLFLTARPMEFSAGLAIESEPMDEDETSAPSRTAPAVVRLSFWIEWGPTPIRWGSEFGSASLPEITIVFEVPFRDLIQGKPFTMTLPYEGSFPEDKGAWKIAFRPGPKSR